MPNETSAEEAPLVSIICRTIGRAELEKTLNSISKQTHPNVELVLVDASAKGLPAIASSFEEINLKFVTAENPLTRPQAANAGLDAASGDFLMLLDDDDWIADDHLEGLVKFSANHQNAKAVYSSTQKTTHQGEPLEVLFSHAFDPVLLMHDNYIPIHSMLFHKSLLEHGCRFDENFDIFEDWDFWLQLSQHTNFKHLDKITAFYREGGKSETAGEDSQSRYDNSGLVGKGRSALFSKWLERWNGSQMNQVLGDMDQSSLIEATTISLYELQEINQQQQHQLLAISQELSTTNQELSTINQELSTTNQELLTTISTLSAAYKQIDDHKKEIDNLNSHLSAAYKKIDDHRKEMDNLNNHLNDVDQNLRQHIKNVEQNSHQHISELENLLNSIRSSLSWKLMWPFRKLMRILKRLLGSDAMPRNDDSDQKKNIVANIDMVKPDSPGNTIHYSIDDTLLVKPDFPENTIHHSIDDTLMVKPDSPGNTIHYSIDDTLLCSGYLYVRGWALASAGISYIRVIAGNESALAHYGQERKDTQAVYPDIANSDRSGFVFFKKVASIETVRLEFGDKAGQSVQIETSYSASLTLPTLSMYADFLRLDHSIQYQIYQAKQELTNLDQKFEPSVFAFQPQISVIIPIFNVDPAWLDACINSVFGQIYENWELCLYDDASTNEETLECLRKWAEHDSRISVTYGKDNLHISGASNNALKMANGEFVGLMDNDDELTNDALYHVIDLLNNHSDADYIYTDEDKIDEEGDYCQPHFKPGWSPELLESMMYVGHFSVIRKSILEQVGGFREGLEGSQDYDLALRIAEISNNFYHIPKILYHWRIIPGSVSGGGDAKQYAYTSAVNALTEHVAKENLNNSAETTNYAGLYRIRRESGNPSVTIIIPFHNKAEMTIDCLKSIKNSSYDNYSIFLISNNSSDDELKLVKNYIENDKRITLEEYNHKFNWASINNWAAQCCESEFLLFLNNDTLIINKDWIESLLDCGIKKNVGAVGAKLLYEDDTIQHAGIIMQIGGIAGHAFRYHSDEVPGYFGYSDVVRNCAAVTGACMLVRKELWQQLDGFDESLRVSYNDVDFCLRLLEINYAVIYTPFAKLYHLESISRPKTIADMSTEELVEFQRESDFLRRRHLKYFKEGDPYYNPNLTLRLENYSLDI